jgi:hypothetical protein
MPTFADKVISFYAGLDFQGDLPPGISIMNPYRDNPEIIRVITKFYRKFYNDNKHRHLILGINPGRFGAGVTGIPFTDTKRLKDHCGIDLPGLETFETSSVFVYEMISRYGGPEKFYSDFYINSLSPLGFTSKSSSGREVNYNYYDSRKLTEAVKGFIVWNIKEQIKMGIECDVCFCFGTGKNFKYLSELNNELKFFGKIVPLEHPRYIMQYKSKKKEFYIDKYIMEFENVTI